MPIRNIASFDVDPQKGFTPLCSDELPVPEGHLIADALNANAGLASVRVGSRDCHPAGALWEAASAEEFLAPVGAENVDIKWFRHCVVGTEGFELLDGLPHPVSGYDFFVNKGLDKDCHPYGACYHDLGETKSTGVIEFLRSRQIDCVIVGGLATDYCVFNTAKQLSKAGFDVHINLEAVRGVAQDSTQKALEEMRRMGIDLHDDGESLKQVLQGK